MSVASAAIKRAVLATLAAGTAVAGEGFELRFGGGGSGREIGCCAVLRNSAGASLGGVDVDRLGGRRERQQRGPQFFFRFDAAV